MTGTGTRRGRLEAPDMLLLGAAWALPWAFGGVTTWASRAAEVLVAAAVVAAVLPGGAGAIGVGRPRPWRLPALLLLAWAVLQVVPLPPQVVRALSPAAGRTYEVGLPPPAAGDDAAAVVERAGLARVPGPAPAPEGPGPLSGIPLPPGWTRWRTLSLQPGATVERTFWFLALLFAFALAVERVARRDRAAAYRDTLHALFVALAVFGLVQYATWNGRLYWTLASDVVRRPFGPFVNANHFAALMVLAAPWMAASALARARSVDRPLLDRGTVARAAGAATCVVAGLVAASKAGAVLMAAGLLAVSLASARTRRARIRVAAAAALVGTVAAVLLSTTYLGERVEEAMESGGATGQARWTMVLTGTRLIRDYPWTGTGFGTFRNVIPAYLPAGEAENWLQAHDDYLEFAIEGGAVGVALLAWLAVGFVRAVRRGQAEDSLRRFGLRVGLAATALHALVEFHLQVPGVAMIFVLACALATASASRET